MGKEQTQGRFTSSEDGLVHLETPVLVCGDPEFASEVLRSVDSLSVRLSRGFNVCEHRSRASCLVVCVREPGTRELNALQDLWNNVPRSRLIPVLAVSGPTVRLVRTIGGLAESVVWSDELPDGLLHAIRRSIATPFVAQAATMLLQRLGELPTVARAVKHCWTSSTPPNAVTDLAARIGVSSSTLRSNFGRIWPGVATPKVMVEWAIVSAAMAERRFAGWSTVAFRMNLHPRTLDRVVERRTGMRLRDLDAVDSLALEAPFWCWVEELESTLPRQYRTGAP